jgi:hypothetical protein
VVDSTFINPLQQLLSSTDQPIMSSANEQHAHRVAGGYKAALHNPNVSEEAKGMSHISSCSWLDPHDATCP